MSHAVKRRLLYPPRNKNVIKPTSTDTLPCKQNWSSSGTLQSRSKSEQVSLLQELQQHCHPHVPSVTAWHSRDSGHCGWSRAMTLSLSYVGEYRHSRCLSQEPRLLTWASTEKGREGMGHKAPSLLQVFSVWRCSQIVACLHSRILLSWSCSVKLERRLIAGLGANELWWSLKIYGD